MDHDHSPTDQQRERILDAAARLMVRYGHDKTTMQEIAASASISKSTLYLFWKSKEEVFAALIAREAHHLSSDWLARVQADPEGGTLFGIYRHGFLSLLAHPLMSAFYTKESVVLGDYVRQRGPAVYGHRYLLNRLFIEHLQAAGLLREDLQPNVINHLLMILSVGLFSVSELIPQEQVPPFEEVAAALAEMVQRALAPEQEGHSEQGKQALQAYLEQLAHEEPA
jgi:TetR/AcrR family acrAB operon transcriptional repressor